MKIKVSRATAGVSSHGSCFFQWMPECLPRLCVRGATTVGGNVTDHALEKRGIKIDAQEYIPIGGIS